MSNAFTNFLSGTVSGIFNNSADLKDYQHADRLYVRDTYARAPKVGFLYFVSLNLNQKITKIQKTRQKEIGMLVKSVALPTFTTQTETVNQYNRKTVVYTGLKYNPIRIEFHDDNSDITTDLWKDYYKYYYADSNYGNSTTQNFKQISAFGDTKYGIIDYAYGLNNFQTEPYFTDIEIYVLHQGKFSQFTLVNPKITEWGHDGLDQNDSTKTLINSAQIVYENVIYKSGKIVKGSTPEGFGSIYYDTTPSPLSIGGKGTSTLFGSGGILAGATDILGVLGNKDASPLDYLSAAIKGRNLIKNAREIKKETLKSEGKGLLKNVLGGLAVVGAGAVLSKTNFPNISVPKLGTRSGDNPETTQTILKD
jgi:hypothetical protein